MATIRICDRCGATVARLLDGTARAVVVPPESPSTNPVPQPVQLEIGVKSANDLCDPCLVSALIEVSLTGLAIPLSAVIAALAARAKAAGKGA